MSLRLSCVLLVALAVQPVAAQRPSGGGADFVPVTDAMLRDPDPADWLMYSRTYDAQRFSPLAEINRGNVSELERAWTKALPDGVIEVIPIVYRGVMYIVTPGTRERSSAVWALDAASGELLWEYVPPGSSSSRLKALAIWGDMLYYTAPAPSGEPQPIVALDAVTGAVRWHTPASVETHTAGAIVVDGKVLSGRTCNSARENCYVAAHDARTGREVWRFYTSPAAGEPGDESWGGAPVSERRVATWGLPGTFDPDRGLVFWGVSNPMPNTRADRHGGDTFAIPTTAPADLYSNSTVALDPATGELVWHYQHLPGDDWDMDIAHEKTLIRPVIDPDPEHVKWINPDVPKGAARDVVVTVGEGGGVWVNDRATGQFIWATPFPYDTPNFIVGDIDVRTGIARINERLLLDAPGKQALICYWNTRSYWPTAYHPELNALFVPYVDHCLEMTRAVPDGPGERRSGAVRPGGDPERFAGLARIDMTSGAITRLYEGRAAGNGAVLATAGGLVFWGDIAQRLRAFDAESGEILWASDPLGATVQTSTITYAVGGKQYVAVINGEPLLGTRTLVAAGNPEIPPGTGTSINVFALPR